MKKRIIIVIAAMVILCGILTGIGIILSDQKPEKQSEEKPEKVEQELEIKSKETQENTKQEMEERELESEPEKQEEEPLSMDLSGLNEDALSMMGISKKEVADALRTWTQEHGFSSATGAQFFGADAGTIFGGKIQHGLPAYLCRWREWNSAGGCANQTDHGLFQREKVAADS